MKQLEFQQSSNSSSLSSIEVKSLQLKNDTLVKEREAVQTIMEQKIKVLVQSVAQATNLVVSSTSNQNAAQSLAKVSYSSFVHSNYMIF